MSFIQSWRWYGPRDIVPLEHIKQAGAQGVVTALHHIPVGEIWPLEEIQKRKNIIEEAGLSWQVVESVNVHDHIKLAGKNRDTFIGNYQQTLINLATAGIRTVCYNFMPLLDWVRTDLAFPTDAGGIALAYNHLALAAFDLEVVKRSNGEDDYDPNLAASARSYWRSLTESQQQALQTNILAGVPGSLVGLDISDFKTRLEEFGQLSAVNYRDHLRYFLQKVVPVAAEYDVKLAIHPDDPPFSLFGMPRIMHRREDFEYLIGCAPDPSNGITFCSGSLAPRPENDLPAMISEFASHIHFVHLRNIISLGNRYFYESDHLQGAVDMAEVIKMLLLEMQRRKQLGQSNWRLPMRPDHGHQILDDLSKQIDFAGYSGIGRLKGLAELRGLELGIAYGLA